QLKSVGVVLLMVGGAGISLAAQADQAPPKELVQYIRENKRRGVDDAKIKRQAVAVGWSAAVIDQAMVYEKTATLPETPPEMPAASGASSQAPPPPRPPSDTGKPAGPPARGDDYLIGAGDTLQISVWKEQEA